MAHRIHSFRVDGSSRLRVQDSSSGGLGSASDSYAFLGSKWGSSQEPGTAGGMVVVSFDATSSTSPYADFSGNFAQGAFRSETQQAFGAWADVADIGFEFAASTTDPADVDIWVGWTDLGGPNGTLGATTLPSTGPLDDVVIGMDPEESWFTGGTAPDNQVDFSGVITHEIGHALGLDHSGYDPSLMSQMYDPQILALQAHDIDAIQALYGVEGVAEPGNGWASIDALQVRAGFFAPSSSLADAINGPADVRYFKVFDAATGTFVADGDGPAADKGWIPQDTLAQLALSETVYYVRSWGAESGQSEWSRLSVQVADRDSFVALGTEALPAEEEVSLDQVLEPSHLADSAYARVVTQQQDFGWLKGSELQQNDLATPSADDHLTIWLDTWLPDEGRSGWSSYHVTSAESGETTLSLLGVSHDGVEGDAVV